MSTIGETTSGLSRSGASAASASTSAPTQVSIESLVCFAIGRRTYALDVSLVREVVTVGTVFSVPNTPAPISGVFSLRGATIALVDTSRLLGFEASSEQGVALLIVRNHQTVCALTIDRVVGVTRFIPAHFIPADTEREPPEIIGFMPDERGGLLTVLDSTVISNALNRLRFR